MTGTTLATHITGLRLTVLACAVALSGCGPMNDDGTATATAVGGDDAMPASAADPQTVQRIRDKYQQAYSESQVGVVLEALDDAPFVAVGELPAPASLRENQAVTFLDRHERVLTTGQIVRVLPDSVHVRVNSPPRGGREPRRGDVMVRTPFGARAL